MNGFEEEIYKNILKSQPHLVLKNTSDDGSDELRCKDFDLSNLVGCKSFSQMNAVVESDSVIQATVIRSYDDSGTPSIAIGADEIMIDASLASHLGIGYQDPLSISIPVVKNNTLSLIRGGSFRVSDIQTPQEIKSSSPEIIMNSMAFKKFTSEKGAEHNLILWLEDPFSVQSIATDIKETIGQTEYEMSDWFELNENLFKAIVIEKAVMTGLLFFVVLIAIFNIMVMISMTIENKKGDIAILKSLGYNQRDVTHIFLIQGCAANIMGVLGGIIISLLVLYNLRDSHCHFHFLAFFSN